MRLAFIEGITTDTSRRYTIHTLFKKYYAFNTEVKSVGDEAHTEFVWFDQFSLQEPFHHNQKNILSAKTT